MMVALHGNSVYSMTTKVYWYAPPPPPPLPSTGSKAPYLIAQLSPKSLFFLRSTEEEEEEEEEEDRQLDF